MSEAAFGVAAVAPRHIDRMMWELGEFRLERDARGAFVVVADHAAADARHILGRAGLRAARCDVATPPERAVAAVLAHLAPVKVPGSFDRVWVCAVPLGRSSATARGAILRRYDADRLKPLLRDEERAYRWRRIVWVPRSRLGAPDLRGARPIVFDRDALSSGHERWGFTRAEHIARWIGG